MMGKVSTLHPELMIVMLKSKNSSREVRVSHQSADAVDIAIAAQNGKRPELIALKYQEISKADMNMILRVATQQFGLRTGRWRDTVKNEHARLRQKAKDERAKQIREEEES